MPDKTWYLYMVYATTECEPSLGAPRISTAPTPKGDRKFAQKLGFMGFENIFMDRPAVFK
jgi:hypothetical protein